MSEDHSNALARLHDATLDLLEFSWKGGTARIRFITDEHGTAVELEGSEVLSIVCPRLFPWGPSDSINELRIEEIPAGRILSIEMQSGDLITITCKQISIVGSRGTAKRADLIS